MTREELNYTRVVWHARTVAHHLSSAQTCHLAVRIRAFGRQRGLVSDRAIAEEAALALKVVSTIESGLAGPTLSTLLALCRGLRVYSVDQLLGFSAACYFDELEQIEAGLAGMTEVLYRQIDEPPIGLGPDWRTLGPGRGGLRR